MRAFSICAIALGKRPPHYRHHTVQVTILRPITTTTTTTTAQVAMHAFSICTTALGKKKTKKQKNKTTSASLCGPGPAPSTLQTTTCAREYMFSMVEYEARYRASYRRSESASPLLACRMLQAHVTCIRVCH